MFAADIRRFARLGAFGLTLCIASSGHATAGSVTFTGVVNVNAGGTLVLNGGGAATTSTSVLTPTVSPIASSGPVPLMGSAAYQPANRNAAADSSSASSDNRGVDEKWGDPLNAGIYDSDTVHAGFNYYYGNAQGASQGGVGFSLTFKN